MIFSFVTNSTPMPLSGMTSVDTFIAGNTPQSASDSEFCYCGECDYIEYAFYSSDSLPHKNDFTSVLVRKFFTSESFAIKVYKSGVYQTTLTDSTYGTFYDFGDLTYAYYKGIIINWGLIAAAFGDGDYVIRVERTFSGTTTGKDSHVYRVMPYSADAAHGTVKVESYQNGNYILSDYAFRDMRWFTSLRMDGRLWNKIPVLESTYYVTSNRQHDQINDNIKNEYTLEMGVLPNYIANDVIYNQALANEIYVTSYDKFDFDIARQLPVKIKSIDPPKYSDRTRRAVFVLKVTDRLDGITKTY